MENENAVSIADDSLPDALRGLTLRQRRYSEYLAIYDNPLKSAKLAGYTIGDSGITHPYTMAADPKILAAVEYWKAIFSSHAHTTPEKVIALLSTISNIDVSTYFRDWQLIPQDELSDEQKQALVGVEIIEKASGRTIKLKFAKLEALKELAHIHGLYEEDKSKAQGLNLTIQLGQQVNVSAGKVEGNPSKDKGLTIDLSQ